MSLRRNFKNKFNQTKDSVLLPELEFHLGHVEKVFTEESDISLVSFIHPNTVLGENVEIGDGTLIFANVHIGTDTSIGKLSFISSNSTIEHHNVIGDAFCCGPSFSTSGLVSIGNNTRVGINVGIEPSIKVGDNVVISSGSIVTSNIDSDKTLKHR